MKLNACITQKHTLYFHSTSCLETCGFAAVF